MLDNREEMKWEEAIVCWPKSTLVKKTAKQTMEIGSVQKRRCRNKKTTEEPKTFIRKSKKDEHIFENYSPDFVTKIREDMASYIRDC